MLVDLRLDSAGIREVLQGPEVRLLVDGVAASIAARARASLSPGVEVLVRGYTTDRGAASVTVADVRGMAWQARDGTLTRAAGAEGLEIRAWGGR
ncbi:hypothetical protein ACQKFA_23290 [Streptomyces sp. CH6]|uniref:hypothetical protein n=1 Tax=Streptomyces sp. CH6 TaxID=3420320 RepID=UPI003D05FFE5